MSRAKDARAAALAVACSVCGAGVGADCTTIGKETTRPPHVPREKLAARYAGAIKNSRRSKKGQQLDLLEQLEAKP